MTIFKKTALTTVTDATKTLVAPVDKTVASNTLFESTVSKGADPSNSITSLPPKTVDMSNTATLAPPKVVTDLVKKADALANSMLVDGSVSPDDAKEQIVASLKQEIAQDIAKDGSLIDKTITKTANDAIKTVVTLSEKEAADAKARIAAKLAAEQAAKEAAGAPKKQAYVEKQEEQKEANQEVDGKKVEFQQDAANTIVLQKDEAINTAHNALAQEQENLNNFAERVAEAVVDGGVIPEPPVSVIEPIAAAVGARGCSVPWWVWLLLAAGGGYLVFRK